MGASNNKMIGTAIQSIKLRSPQPNGVGWGGVKVRRPTSTSSWTNAISFSQICLGLCIARAIPCRPRSPRARGAGRSPHRSAAPCVRSSLRTSPRAAVSGLSSTAKGRYWECTLGNGQISVGARFPRVGPNPRENYQRRRRNLPERPAMERRSEAELRTLEYHLRVGSARITNRAKCRRSNWPKGTMGF